MANNPYVNKVVYGNTTVMDISDTTATASDVAQGKYFYSASGQKVEGTASGGGGSAITVIDETLPNGATAKHITAVDISDTTAVASDVAQGKYFYTALGQKTAGTASGGGGGASNFVTGTFTTIATASTRGTITIPYTGDGYPLLLVIVVEGGLNNPNISGWYNSLIRYAVGQFVISKGAATTAPTYDVSGRENYGACNVVYRNSDTVSTTFAGSGSGTTNSYTYDFATGAMLKCVVWWSGNRIDYRTAGGTSSSYGLLRDTTYRYYVVYSS